MLSGRGVVSFDPTAGAKGFQDLSGTPGNVTMTKRRALVQFAAGVGTITITSPLAATPTATVLAQLFRPGGAPGPSWPVTAHNRTTGEVLFAIDTVSGDRLLYIEITP